MNNLNYETSKEISQIGKLTYQSLPLKFAFFAINNKYSDIKPLIHYKLWDNLVSCLGRYKGVYEKSYMVTINSVDRVRIIKKIAKDFNQDTILFCFKTSPYKIKAVFYNVKKDKYEKEQYRVLFTDKKTALTQDHSEIYEWDDKKQKVIGVKYIILRKEG